MKKEVTIVGDEVETNPYAKYRKAYLRKKRHVKIKNSDEGAKIETDNIIILRGYFSPAEGYVFIVTPTGEVLKVVNPGILTKFGFDPYDPSIEGLSFVVTGMVSGGKLLIISAGLDGFGAVKTTEKTIDKLYETKLISGLDKEKVKKDVYINGQLFKKSIDTEAIKKATEFAPIILGAPAGPLGVAVQTVTFDAVKGTIEGTVKRVKNALSLLDIKP